MKPTGEILVIGGGVIGLAIALELNQQGASVTIVTRDFAKPLPMPPLECFHRNNVLYQFAVVGFFGVAFPKANRVSIHALVHFGAQSLHAFALQPIISLCTLRRPRYHCYGATTIARCWGIAQVMLTVHPR